MKKITILLFLLICMLGLLGCTPNKGDPYVVNTYEETSADLMEEYLESSKIITTVTYYEAPGKQTAILININWN